VSAVSRQRVLVVDDDSNVAEVVSRYLEREGYEVASVGDGPAAINRAAVAHPDLVVLDLMLPGLDGIEVCRKLRELAPVPIIMLTARGEESDRIAGLEVGADDYMVKPFSPRELVARVRAVLRRAAGSFQAANGGGPEVLAVGDLEIDLRSRIARLAGAAIALTTLEFDLLAFFMQHVGTAFRREDLLERVWGFSSGDTSTVTVHVRRLREKIERDPARPERVRTVWGVGYRFDP